MFFLLSFILFFFLFFAFLAVFLNQEVSKEKALTETRWREEKQMRIKTEKRLKLAEDSLKRLDRALRDSGVHIDLQIETDVRNLKSKSGSYAPSGYSITFVAVG